MATPHILKTWPEYFDAIWIGLKTFELRVNDRDFHYGDLLILREYVPDTDRYTGRIITATVGFMVQGVWGLPEDTCAMSLLNVQYYGIGVVSMGVEIEEEAGK